MHLKFGAATDPGRVRARNEDCFVADGDLGFFAVIDGMGVPQKGEKRGMGRDESSRREGAG